MNRRGPCESSACCSSDETEWMRSCNGKDHWHHWETQTETNGTADGEEPNISTRWSQQAPKGLMGIRYDGNHGTKSTWSWVWFPLCQKLSNFSFHPLVVYFSRFVFCSIHSEHIVLQCLCTSEMHRHTFRLLLSWIPDPSDKIYSVTDRYINIQHLWLLELPITCVNIITRIPSAKPQGNMHHLSSICQKLKLKDNWGNGAAEPHIVTPVSARSPGWAIVLFYEQLQMDGDWRLSVNLPADVTVTGNRVWTWYRCSISVCVGRQLHHCCCAFLMHLILWLSVCPGFVLDISFAPLREKMFPN